MVSCKESFTNLGILAPLQVSRRPQARRYGEWPRDARRRAPWPPFGRGSILVNRAVHSCHLFHFFIAHAHFLLLYDKLLVPLWKVAKLLVTKDAPIRRAVPRLVNSTAIFRRPPWHHGPKLNPLLWLRRLLKLVRPVPNKRPHDHIPSVRLHRAVRALVPSVRIHLLPPLLFSLCASPAPRLFPTRAAIMLLLRALHCLNVLFR